MQANDHSLVDRFVRDDECDMHENCEQLVVPWDPTQPIDTLFTHLNHCRTFAVAGVNQWWTHSSLTLLSFSWKTAEFSLKHTTFGA
jgi:hypothetical protein